MTTEGHDASPRAIHETLGPEVQHRTSRDKNNRIAQGSPAKLVLRLNITCEVGRTARKWLRISAARPAFGHFRGCRPYVRT